MPDIEQKVTAFSGIFVSRYSHCLDPKKRLTIPSEWRDQVGAPNSLYILPDVHCKCISVFPASDMMQRIQALKKYSITDKAARQFLRTLASQSDMVVWDAQGRIRIKDELLLEAGISEQVELVGAFDHFEIWNPDNYRANRGSGQNLKDAAKYVGL
jgi:MraZ protein